MQPPLAADVLGIPATAKTDLEKIASYRPDLILAVTSPQVLDRESYDRLSAIAPVVVYATALFGSSMQDDARQIGRALGTEAKVAELIAAADARVAALRTELPALAGRTYLFGQARGEVLPMVVGEQNLSTVFMRSLGLRVPDNFVNAPATAALAPGTVGVSYEQVGMLDSADALFVTFAGTGDRERFEGSPLVQQLRAVKDGTFLPLTLDQAVALQAPNVVAVDWLIGQLRPTLVEGGGRIGSGPCSRRGCRCCGSRPIRSGPCRSGSASTGFGDATGWLVDGLARVWAIDVQACDRIIISDANAVAWVRTDRGPLVAKWSRAQGRFARLAAVADLLRALHAQGLPVAPPLTAIDGRNREIVESGPTPLSLTVQPLVEGELLDVTDETAVRRAGACLASLHDALAAHRDSRLTGVRPADLRRGIEAWLERDDAGAAPAASARLRDLVEPLPPIDTSNRSWSTTTTGPPTSSRPVPRSAPSSTSTRSARPTASTTWRTPSSASAPGSPTGGPRRRGSGTRSWRGTSRCGRSPRSNTAGSGRSRSGTASWPFLPARTRPGGRSPWSTDASQPAHSASTGTAQRLTAASAR